MTTMQRVNSIVSQMQARIDSEVPCEVYGELKVGVDLGTSNIVITVLDQEDRPVAGAMQPANVVKDGIVVEYVQAVSIVKGLKEKLERRLDRELSYAATAIPPGIMEGNIKVIKNVVEASGFEVANVVEEPVAAAKVLNIQDGAVVDIGGGTTGISVLKDGKVLFSTDEPTGGTHLTLVLAGNLGLEFEEAEMFKLNPQNESIIFPAVRPVIEKMAEITRRSIKNYNIDRIYLVGGACCLNGIEEVFQKYTSIETVKPDNPLLVTPIGIAMAAG
ncbi:MAG: ethanolamine utilization protein EutJ [Peptococcaceae bacterium]|nr:ethanolamine utilization protein EutJ [Peptococcaceae bacterium]